MGKTSKDQHGKLNRKQEQKREKRGAMYEEEYRQRKHEKILRNALRSNNVDELIDIETY